MVNKDTARHPKHGLEQWFAVGAVSGVEGVAANGVADSHVFEDGATVVTMNVNIYEAPKGSTYVGWVKKPGATEKIRLGTFERPFSDVRHRMTGEIEQDLTGYTEVLVTLEKNSGVTESDPVQATGLMKQRQR